MEGFITQASNFVWSPALVALCLLGGLWFSVRGRFLQLRLIGEMIRLLFQKISVFAGIYGCGSDDFFPDSIDRRVRYLREQLLEIIKQRLIFFGKDSQRCIHTHRADPFGSV